MIATEHCTCIEHRWIGTRCVSIVFPFLHSNRNWGWLGNTIFFSGFDSPLVFMFSSETDFCVCKIQKFSTFCPFICNFIFVLGFGCNAHRVFRIFAVSRKYYYFILLIYLFVVLVVVALVTTHKHTFVSYFFFLSNVFVIQVCSFLFLCSHCWIELFSLHSLLITP